MKIAFFGGTFDPIHLGHIQLADTAVKEMNLDELYFMPNFISPFKTDSFHSSAEDRLEMINRVLKYNDAFKLSRYEIDRKEISYTYVTLCAMKELFDNNDIFFLLGFDSVVALDTWYMGKELLRRFSIITGVRPGTPDEDGLNKINEYRSKYNSNITILHSPYVDVSATEIRERVAEGKSLDGLVSKEVEDYIYEKNLYKD